MERGAVLKSYVLRQVDKVELLWNAFYNKRSFVRLIAWCFNAKVTRINQKFWDVIVVRWVVAEVNKESGASVFKGEAVQFEQMSPRKIWILRIIIFFPFSV